MTKLTQKIALGGVNLLALGISAGDATVLAPRVSNSDASQTQAMDQGQLRAIEAAHLEIFAACKWGHAAFDPIKVDSEVLSPEVQSIYNQMV